MKQEDEFAHKKEVQEKAILEFADKMEKHHPQGDKHTKLFKRLTWSGEEIDWTRILEFIIFAIAGVLIFGIGDYNLLQKDKKILENQDIIKQNQMVILESNHDKKDLIMELNRQHNLVINLLLKDEKRCNRCHKVVDKFCDNKE